MDEIKHECGIALVRLLKPLDYYQKKYGTWRYGLQKLYLLMEKQHNRGQDGAGVVTIKFDLAPGKKYIDRSRSNDPSSINEVFKKINADFNKLEKQKSSHISDSVWVKENLPFAGELYLGHLRYGTYGKNELKSVHPVMRQNNWKSRNLVLAGNFNLTNVDELFQILIDLGQHPKDYSDTVTILENVGHFLDTENQKLFNEYKKEGKPNIEISHLIASNLNLQSVLKESSKKWDGGYVIAGLIGHGDAFVTRDPWGIRPAYYYFDDEVAVVTSERPAIQTVFNAPYEKIHEIPPGFAVIIKRNGRFSIDKVREPMERKACSFERIYFSRGGDQEIYKERVKLGELLTPLILKAISYDLKNTVFSYIPNTAETAFYGMIKGIEDYMLESKKQKLIELNGKFNHNDLIDIISARPRIEKVAIKDIKLRTFITQDKNRDDLVGHVYDITYGTVKKGVDNLVIIDDSIVRGTTLRQSILKILDRLGPKHIIIVSSSPQIRYPDCYGIDMARLADFVAFKAAIELLKDSGLQYIIDEVYQKAKQQILLPVEQIKNCVKEIYNPFSAEQISGKIAEMLSKNNINAEVKIVYQTIENLHEACPMNLGDWYFTGNYPTPGGNRVVNRSFINFIEGRNERAY
ncbi:MAG: amidophosphoribosyltransferase [Bacteroidales bacterium]|nr:amidophosphoribosyltransferase [Bacteroidales bacterium]